MSDTDTNPKKPDTKSPNSVTKGSNSSTPKSSKDQASAKPDKPADPSSSARATIYISRTSADSVTVVGVWDGKHYVGSYVGNAASLIDSSTVIVYKDGKPVLASDYKPGTEGPADGTYKLLPKSNSEKGDKFPDGTPAITGLNENTPGFPNSHYKNPVLMHQGGAPGWSTACQTVSENVDLTVQTRVTSPDGRSFSWKPGGDVLKSIQNIMDSHPNNTYVNIMTEPPGTLPALPSQHFPFVGNK